MLINDSNHGALTETTDLTWDTWWWFLGAFTPKQGLFNSAYFVDFFFLIQYLSRGIQFSRASLNGALTQHKNKDIKTLKLDNWFSYKGNMYHRRYCLKWCVSLIVNSLVYVLYHCKKYYDDCTWSLLPVNRNVAYALPNFNYCAFLSELLMLVSWWSCDSGFEHGTVVGLLCFWSKEGRN